MRKNKEICLINNVISKRKKIYAKKENYGKNCG
jgi:hypothetical protein